MYHLGMTTVSTGYLYSFCKVLLCLLVGSVLGNMIFSIPSLYLLFQNPNIHFSVYNHLHKFHTRLQVLLIVAHLCTHECNDRIVQKYRSLNINVNRDI